MIACAYQTVLVKKQSVLIHAHATQNASMAVRTVIIIFATRWDFSKNFNFA